LAAWTIPAMRAAAGVLSRVPAAHGLRQRRRMLAAVVRSHSFDPASEPDESVQAEQRAIDALGPLSSVLYRSFHHESLPRILRDFDAHSMGHGVEVRMPLLDWRLVCYAFSVPDESKIAAGYTKRLLREAMRGLVPDPVRLRRDKIGFTAPVAAWLDGALAGWLWNELNDPEFLRSELWDGPALLALARAKRGSSERWQSAEARRVALAVTAHWWQTRWLRSAERPLSSLPR
jgi:asparagine synthetase B (glutamine-hydrolysing)